MEQQETRMRENWFDPEYVKVWLDRQEPRTRERLFQFAMIRSVIPRRAEDSFSILDVGGGDGWLAEELLKRFSRATVTVLDQSSVMVERARERLRPLGSRATAVAADLRSPSWRDALAGPVDVAVSTIAIHNLNEGTRIRELYGEICSVIADGGCFLTLDYMRPQNQSVAALARWAHSDPDARYSESERRLAQPNQPRAQDRPDDAERRQRRGTFEEQLSWLRDGGFDTVECLWKEFQTALLGGFKGPLQVPEER